MAADGAYPSVASISARNSAAVVSRGRTLRDFALGMAPLVAAGATYELLRPVFHYRAEVHTGDLFALEAALFPVPTATGTVALSDVIARGVHPALDLVTGTTYLLFLAELVVLSVFLFFRDRQKMLELTAGFFLVNLLGWLVWFVYPAAPPWYIDAYGGGPALLDAPSSAAGLERFDALIGLPLAATFYAKSANVFGAMPSLHVAYAALAAGVAFPLKGAVRLATLAFALSMAFSAVYLRHHYLLDVLAGIVLAVGVAVALSGAFARLGQRAEGPA